VSFAESLAKTSTELLIELRRSIAADTRSTAAIRQRAIDLAYEVGKSEGYHTGKIEGIEETHASHMRTLEEKFGSLKVRGE
jgi:hypothetical protein